jgi:hypothetical protein
MKTIVSLLFIFYVLQCSGQLADHPRGLYVNQFFTASNNDWATVELDFTILGDLNKENDLLQYAKDNHITYLCLYDFRSIVKHDNAVTSNYYLPKLRDFICRAKHDYCIKKIGVALSNTTYFPNVITSNNVTPAFIFSPQDQLSPYYPLLSFVEQTYSITDPLFSQAEYVKDLLRLITLSNPDYNPQVVVCNTDDNIDIINIEYEFWNKEVPFFYSGTGGVSSNFMDIVESLNLTRSMNNSNSANHPLSTEVYLGFLDDNAYSSGQQNSCSVGEWIDGIYYNPNGGNGTSYRRLDRIFTHWYNKDPSTVYNNFNTNGYYTNRFKVFDESSCSSISTADNTDLHPLISAEGQMENSIPPNNFLGDAYFRTSSSNNIFTAEKEVFDDFAIDGSAGTHDLTNGNDMQPGACQWFAYSYMYPYLDHPITFQSDASYCTSSSTTVKFKYQGPIEKGISYSFTLMDGQNNVITPTAGLTSGISPDYAINGQQLIALPEYNLSPSPQLYTATLELDYPDNTIGCNYVYIEKIYVSSHPSIIALQHDTKALSPPGSVNPISICDGERVVLKASLSSSGTYQWMRNGMNIVDNVENPVNETPFFRIKLTPPFRSKVPPLFRSKLTPPIS